MTDSLDEGSDDEILPLELFNNLIRSARENRIEPYSCLGCGREFYFIGTTKTEKMESIPEDAIHYTDYDELENRLRTITRNDPCMLHNTTDAILNPALSINVRSN